MALRSYFLTLAGEPKFTNPVEVLDYINGSQDQQGYGPEWYPEIGLEKSSPARGFCHGPDLQCGFPHPSLSLSVEARRVISNLKQGHDPALPYTYRTVSPFGTIVKLFEL